MTRTTTPAPTRETLKDAFAQLLGGPASVGELAFAVCDVLGIDTQGVSGSYDLRGRFAYQTFITRLHRMCADGEAVVMTRGEWHELTRGAMFRDGNPATRAYATAEAAQQMRGALRRAGHSDIGARHELALHMARQRLLQEHADTVRAYAIEWLKEHEQQEEHRAG